MPYPLNYTAVWCCDTQRLVSAPRLALYLLGIWAWLSHGLSESLFQHLKTERIPFSGPKCLSSSAGLCLLKTVLFCHTQAVHPTPNGTCSHADWRWLLEKCPSPITQTVRPSRHHQPQHAPEAGEHLQENGCQLISDRDQIQGNLRLSSCPLSHWDHLRGTTHAKAFLPGKDQQGCDQKMRTRPSPDSRLDGRMCRKEAGFIH